MLPGLERLNLPIPLGGTSNHFRTDVLRELHAWDPFNVTEDADLGIRIGQKGFRVGVVDSTTFEESSCRVSQWVRQRSRWMKGYMQTLLVHTRRPLQFLRSAGPLGFLGFLFFIGGTVFAGLLNPLFWASYLVWLAVPASSLDAIFPQALLFLSLFNLLAGNGAFIYLSMIAPIRRGWLELVPYSLTIPAYWVLISVAAYRGLWQLLRNPHFWEKTQHGISTHPQAQLADAGEALVRRALAAAPVAALCARGQRWGSAAAAVQAGFVADDTLRLWAGASTAVDGGVSIGRIVAGYPTIPFLTTTAGRLARTRRHAGARPGGGRARRRSSARAVFLAFRGIGLSILAAGIAALLVVLHPALLAAALGGPADMFLALFLFMLCRALYDLRARSGTSEVMAIGLALLGLAFSHPMGAALGFAAVPFLAFAVRPALVVSSAFNVVIALIFPTVFALAAFSYVSWIFPGAGWSFFAAPAQSLAILERGGGARRSATGCRASARWTPASPWRLRSCSARRIAWIALAGVRRRRPLDHARPGVRRHRDRHHGARRRERPVRRSDRARGSGPGAGRHRDHPGAGRARAACLGRLRSWGSAGSAARPGSR